VFHHCECFSDELLLVAGHAIGLARSLSAMKCHFGV
jgi:hypothetical protein